MTSLRVGYMEADWLEDEVLAIADLFLRANILTVHVTYGFGCDTQSVLQAEDIPVSTDHLADFIADSEEREIFRLGESDLKVKAGLGKAEFLLCHENDIHFSGEESKLLRQIRSRWSRRYEACYEKRSGGRWRPISVANPFGEQF